MGIEKQKQVCILVVDDESDIINLVKIAIASEDPECEKFNILTAGNTKDALDLLHSNEVDHLWLDNRMPGENGIDFARKIRNNPADYPFANKISIVLISATSEQDLVEGDKYLFDGRFPKPFDIDAIINYANKLHTEAQQTKPKLHYPTSPSNSGLFFQVFNQSCTKAA